MTCDRNMTHFIGIWTGLCENKSLQSRLNYFRKMSENATTATLNPSLDVTPAPSDTQSPDTLPPPHPSLLQGTLLKPNMVTPGQACPTKATPQQVAGVTRHKLVYLPEKRKYGSKPISRTQSTNQFATVGCRSYSGRLLPDHSPGGAGSRLPLRGAGGQGFSFPRSSST